MELQHVNIKIPLAGPLGLDPARFIDLFHGWIQDQLFDELLIDVADYRHVPDGPGVLLVGYEADYAMDQTGGTWGLRYNRKARLGGSNADRFEQALRAAVAAMRRLVADLDGESSIPFCNDRFELLINDRALAPNTADTLAAVKPEVEAFVQAVFGQAPAELGHDDDPRKRFSLTVRLDRPVDWADI